MSNSSLITYVATITTATGTHYYADRHYTSSTGDTPASQYFEGILIQPLELTRTVSITPESKNDGSASGTISILNFNNSLDGVLDEIINGYSIDIKTGTKGGALSADFDNVFNGQGFDFSTDEKGVQVDISVRDNTYILERPINTVYSTSVHNVPVDSGLVGESQPLGYGKIYHAEPVLINSTGNIYQIHNAQPYSIDSIKISGVSQTFTANYADITLATSLTTGQYATEVANGMFRLGSTPDGPVSVTFTGDRGFYSDSSTASIARQALIDFGYSTGGFDSSWSTMATAGIGEAGYYIQNTEIAKDVLTKLIKGVGWYWYTKDDGSLAVDQVYDPSSATTTLYDADILSLRRLMAPEHINPPHWRRRVRYKKTWKNIVGNISSAAGGTDRLELSRDGLVAVQYDVSVQTDFPLAQDPELLESYLTTQSDALSLASGLLALHKEKRTMYEIIVDSRTFNIAMGETVSITYGRYNLSAALFLAFPVRYDARNRETTLVLWG